MKWSRQSPRAPSRQSSPPFAQLIEQPVVDEVLDTGHDFIFLFASRLAAHSHLLFVLLTFFVPPHEKLVWYLRNVWRGSRREDWKTHGLLLSVCDGIQVAQTHLTAPRLITVNF
ncbi:hypothetical protein FI667_g17332, partial [Globisporangium splendens]